MDNSAEVPRKVIARIRGGLGNQLFCYAAARRLSLVNGAELVIDDVSGFIRDREYHRRYQLEVFNIPARKATPAERMEPFERVRRFSAKLRASGQPFSKRKYVVQENDDFDPRLLEYKVTGTIHLDGLWQSEGYFREIEGQLREDLELREPVDETNRALAALVGRRNSVCVHVRWFDTRPEPQSHNVGASYYRRAIAMIQESVRDPHYLVFSDNTSDALNKLPIAKNRATVVTHNSKESKSHLDIWLMSRASKFIIPNSTFSWWAAWLSTAKNKVVICPSADSTSARWDFSGQIPDSWVKL